MIKFFPDLRKVDKRKYRYIYIITFSGTMVIKVADTLSPLLSIMEKQGARKFVSPQVLKKIDQPLR